MYHLQVGHNDALFLFHSLYIFLKLWHGSLCRPGSLNWDDNLLLSLLIGTRAQISEKRKMMSWLLRICSVCLHFYSSTVLPALLSCQSYPGDTFSIWQLGGLSDFLSSPVYDFRSWGWDTPSGNWTCGQGGCSESALWLQVSSLPPWQLLWTLEMLIANEGALSSFSWPISSPCLALEELVAELPLAHLNRLNLFKGFKSLHIKTSLMEVPHAFPLPTDNYFILLVLMSDFGAAFCTVEQGLLQLPEWSSFTRKEILDRIISFFISIVSKICHDWQVWGRGIWSTWFSFFRVLYIETVAATAIMGRIMRTFKGLRP